MHFSGICVTALCNKLRMLRDRDARDLVLNSGSICCIAIINVFVPIRRGIYIKCRQLWPAYFTFLCGIIRRICFGCGNRKEAHRHEQAKEQ